MKRLREFGLGACWFAIAVAWFPTAAQTAPPTPSQEAIQANASDPWSKPIATDKPPRPDVAPTGYEDAPPNPRDAEAAKPRAKNKPEAADAAVAQPAAPQDDDAPPGYGEAAQADDDPPPILNRPIVMPTVNASPNADNIQEWLAKDLEAELEILDAQVGANIKNYEQQLMPQHYTMMFSELSFLHRTCETNVQQRRAIHEIGVKATHIYVRQVAMQQMGVQRPPNRLGGNVKMIERLVELALIHAAKECLPAEQAQRYAQAVAHRASRQRRAGAKILVADLDRRLVLSPEQRTRLVEKIEEHCENAWSLAGQFQMHDYQYFPSSIPDSLVVDELTPEQATIWRSIVKAELHQLGFTFAHQHGLSLNDFPLGDE